MQLVEAFWFFTYNYIIEMKEIGTMYLIGGIAYLKLNFVISISINDNDNGFIYYNQIGLYSFVFKPMIMIMEFVTE